LLYDHRTYTCRPGTIRKALELYAEHGFTAQSRHLGKPVLYAVTEVGNVNQYVHIWAYKDAAERATRRAAMQADPEWQNYLRMSAEAGYLEKQENKLLLTAPFLQS
jgi:NIPSNAP protein